MRTLTIEEAAPQLLQLAHDAECGEEIILTQANYPVARLTAVGGETAPPRRPRTAKGIILHIADDFDDTPEGFEEYLPAVPVTMEWA